MERALALDIGTIFVDVIIVLVSSLVWLSSMGGSLGTCCCRIFGYFLFCTEIGALDG